MYKLFWPSGDSFPEFPTNINRISKGLELLGPPFGETKHFFDQFLSSRLAKVVAAQVELHLLRSCVGSKIIHLLRTVPFGALHSFLKEFDSCHKECLSCFLQWSLPNDSWCQASHLGGLGLHSSFSTAAAAFLGSCNSVCLYWHLNSFLKTFMILCFQMKIKLSLSLMGFLLISLFPLLPSEMYRLY